MIAYLFGIAFIICSLYVVNVTPLAVTYIIVGTICAFVGSVIGTMRKRTMLLVYLFGVLFGVFSIWMKEFTKVSIVYIIAAAFCAIWGSIGLESIKMEKKKEEKRRERMERLSNLDGQQSV